MRWVFDFWYVWPIGIALWVGIGWLEFGYFEAKAIANPSPTRITLSYFVYYICTKFPIATFYGGLFVGLFFGTLSTHFLWHWCPAGSLSIG